MSEKICKKDNTWTFVRGSYTSKALYYQQWHMPLFRRQDEFQLIEMFKIDSKDNLYWLCNSEEVISRATLQQRDDSDTYHAWQIVAKSREPPLGWKRKNERSRVTWRRPLKEDLWQLGLEYIRERSCHPMCCHTRVGLCENKFNWDSRTSSHRLV